MPVSASKTWVLLALALLVALGCESPTPVAPAESGLSISANPTRIAIDGSAEITVFARKPDGAAVNEGTEITFTTTLGTIDPKIALTDDRGKAVATLTGDGRVGLATVEASSGAAVPVLLEIQIGAQPRSLGLQANPGRLPMEGGEATLVAQVFDELGNALSDVNIRFGTEAGSLESGGRAVSTGSDGEATDILTLTEFDVDGVDEGFFLVTAETIDDMGAPLLAEFEIEIGGFATTVNLSVTPSTVSPSGGEFSLVATVLADGGEPIEDAAVFFDADTGTLLSGGTARRTDADGVASDTLSVSPVDLDAFAGSAINVFASTIGLGGEEVLGTDQILVSTNRGVIILEASPSQVATDVTTVVTLTASVFDEASQPLEGAGVVFLATATCVADVSVCGTGDLANEGQILVTNINGQVSTTLTVEPSDVTDDMDVQETSSITITVETLILGETLTDSASISVVPP